MEAYTSFAQVYDLFMDNVPYEEWSIYLREQLQQYHIADGLVLDLGCGTGKMTRRMKHFGYDMIGVDYSMEMLEMAREANEEQTEEIQERSILYLLQDMREFELYGTVRAVISCCDSLNYLLEEEELLTVFQLVNNYLDPGGIFIFDMNTPYKYQKLLAENTFAESREVSSFIWDNYYDPDEKINEYDLTLFIQAEDGRFDRFCEQHYQKCYDLAQVRQLIEEAGLEFVAVYDAYTSQPLRDESERMTIIARECQKNVKRK